MVLPVPVPVPVPGSLLCSEHCVEVSTPQVAVKLN